MTKQEDPNTDFEGRLLAQLRAVVAERAEAAAGSEAAAGPTTPATPAWRRGPRLALGGGVAVAAVAAGLIVSAGGDNAPAAYAVETQPGGGVKIEIFDLGDPEGIEGALEDAGVNSQVTYLEPGMTCREPHYQPSMALMRTLQEGQPQPQPWAGFNYESLDGPLTIAIGDYQQRKEMDEEIHEAYRQGDRSGEGWPSFVVDPTGLRPDQTLIMSSAPAPEGYQQPLPDGADQEGIHYIPSQQPIDTVGQVRVAEGEVEPCEPVPAGDGVASVRAPQGGWDFGDTPYAGWGFGSGLGAAK
jgi:hypothetical protein